MDFPKAEAERKNVPMILKLRPSDILYAVNGILASRGDPLIPIDADISVEDSCGGTVDLDERDRTLDIRWEQTL